MNLSESEKKFTIEGRVVSLPVEVRDAWTCMAAFAVPAATAERLLAPCGLEPVRLPGARALLTLAYVRYEDSDLDRYHELAVGFPVRRHDAPPASSGRASDLLPGRLAVYIHRLPVDQTFTLAAGRAIWGYPKTLESFDVRADRRGITCTLRQGDREALTLTVRRGGIPWPFRPLPTYTFTDGLLRLTRWEARMDGVRGRPGGAHVRLGHGEIAEELRGLGLPRRALFSSTARRVRARFGPPRVVAASSRAG